MKIFYNVWATFHVKIKKGNCTYFDLNRKNSYRIWLFDQYWNKRMTKIAILFKSYKSYKNYWDITWRYLFKVFLIFSSVLKYNCERNNINSFDQ